MVAYQNGTPCNGRIRTPSNGWIGTLSYGWIATPSNGWIGTSLMDESDKVQGIYSWTLTHIYLNWILTEYNSLSAKPNTCTNRLENLLPSTY